MDSKISIWVEKLGQERHKKRDPLRVKGGAAILFLAVLPAEYEIDPIEAGRMLALIPMDEK